MTSRERSSAGVECVVVERQLRVVDGPGAFSTVAWKSYHVVLSRRLPADGIGRPVTRPCFRPARPARREAKLVVVRPLRPHPPSIGVKGVRPNSLVKRTRVSSSRPRRRRSLRARRLAIDADGLASLVLLHIFVPVPVNGGASERTPEKSCTKRTPCSSSRRASRQLRRSLLVSSRFSP